MLTREDRARRFRAECMAALRRTAENYFHDCPIEGETPTEAALREKLEHTSEDFGTEDNNLVKDMIGEVAEEYEGRIQQAASCAPALPWRA